MTIQTEVPMQIQLPEAADTTAPDPAPEENTSGVNWAEEAGEMGDTEGLETVEGDVEVLAAPVAEEEVASVAPAPAAPTVPVAPVPAPVVEPAPQPIQATPVAPVVPTAPVVSAPEPFDMAKWEKEQLGGLEKLYAISPEDAERLQTEPEIVMPKLAANMHMMVTKSLMTAVQGMIPEYLAMHTQQVSIEQEARNSFYTAHPELNDPKYEAAVMQVGKMFRAANPTAPREVAIKTIGDMVKQSLGISAVPTAAAAPSAPAIPAARPFTPAKGGGQRAAPKASNMWADMIDDD